MTKKCEEKRQDDIREIQRQLRLKEKRVRQKLAMSEQQRLEEVEIKKERQRLIKEDAEKRVEFKKRNLNFKKLQVLDKHQRIDDLCSKLTTNKNSFIECSRIANEIRV